MTPEENPWTEGAQRNTIGHPGGATGQITGGVEGHAKARPNDNDTVDRSLRAAEPKPKRR